MSFSNLSSNLVPQLKEGVSNITPSKSSIDFGEMSLPEVISPLGKIIKLSSNPLLVAMNPDFGIDEGKSKSTLSNKGSSSGSPQNGNGKIPFKTKASRLLSSIFLRGQAYVALGQVSLAFASNQSLGFVAAFSAIGAVSVWNRVKQDGGLGKEFDNKYASIDASTIKGKIQRTLYALKNTPQITLVSAATVNMVAAASQLTSPKGSALFAATYVLFGLGEYALSAFLSSISNGKDPLDNLIKDITGKAKKVNEIANDKIRTLAKIIPQAPLYFNLGHALLNTSLLVSDNPVVKAFGVLSYGALALSFADIIKDSSGKGSKKTFKTFLEKVTKKSVDNQIYMPLCLSAFSNFFAAGGIALSGNPQITYVFLTQLIFGTANMFNAGAFNKIVDKIYGKK
jgi:hypothetical protein